MGRHEKAQLGAAPLLAGPYSGPIVFWSLIAMSIAIVLALTLA